MSAPVRPIFILGAARSGTTLLRLIFDGHSRISCPPESAFLVQLARVFEIERSRQGLRDMGFDDGEVLAQLRRCAEHFFVTYAGRKGKARWADKSGYIPQASFIDRLFEETPHYVLIVRHGLDACYSLCEMDWRNFGSVSAFLGDDGDRPLAAARYWVDRNQSLIDHAARVGERARMIRYEDLTADPLGTLKPVFEFLGEPFEPGAIDYHAHPHDQGNEDLKVGIHPRVVANSGRYRDWPDEIRARVLDVIRPTLRLLDYDDEIRE